MLISLSRKLLETRGMNTSGMDAQSYNRRPSTISTNALLSTGTGTQDNLATGSQATQTALVAEVELSLPPPYPYDYKGDTLTMICFIMITSSNGNFFWVTGHLCRELTGHRWIPHTKASDVEFSCFFNLRPNRRLSKQWWGWWFVTPSRPLWRHCYVVVTFLKKNHPQERGMGCLEWFQNFDHNYAMTSTTLHRNALYRESLVLPSHVNPIKGWWFLWKMNIMCICIWYTEMAQAQLFPPNMDK